MPDPLVFGPEDRARRCHCGHPWCRYCHPEDRARLCRCGRLWCRHAEAEAIRRAYVGHGDQLGALEAEAARDSTPLTATGWLRGLLRWVGPWTSEPVAPRVRTGAPAPRRPRPP